MAKVLCAEIGKSVMKLCEMDDKAKNPKVYHFLEAATPEGVISDGYLNPDRMELLQDALKEVLASNSIKTKKIIFSVVSGKIINREITIPAVKVNQINNIVMTNLTEYFPVELSDYETTNALLETYKEGSDAGKHRVLVMAAEKKLISQYRTLAKGCGLTLANMTYGGNSVFQAMKDKKDPEACAVVKVEEGYTAITIMKDGQLMLQRSVPYGVEEVIKKIQESNSYQAKNFLEAWKFAARQDCTKDEEIRQMLEGILSSISRIIDYYNSHSNESEVKQILLVGMGAEIMGFPEIAESYIGTPCEIVKKMGRVTLNTNIPDRRMGTFLGCVGAGLSLEGFVHDQKKEKEKNKVNYARLSVLVGVLLLSLSGVMVVISYLPYQEQVEEENRLTRLKTEYEPGKVMAEQCDALKVLYDQLQYGGELTKHQNDGLLNFLEELEKQLPKDVLIEEFSSDDASCVMKLKVADKEIAAKVIENLRSFDSVMTVRMETMEEESTETSEQAKLHVKPTSVTMNLECIYYPSIAESDAE